MGRPLFTISELVSELVWPGATDIGILERAGGIHSPIADDGGTLILIDQRLGTSLSLQLVCSH